MRKLSLYRATSTPLLVTLLLCICATISTGVAQTTQPSADPQQEQRARAVIDTLFDSLAQQLQLQLTTAAAIHGYTFQRDYQLTTTDDGRFSAVIEALSVDTATSTIDLAPLTIIVNPLPDQTAALELTLPERINVRPSGSNDGSEPLTLSIGGQDLRGIWSERHSLLTEINGQLSDLRLDIPTSGEALQQIKLSALNLRHELSIDADQRWRQNSILRGNALSLAGDTGGFSADSLNLDLTGSGTDISALLQQSEQLQQLQINAASPEQLQQLAIKPLLDLFSLEGDYGVTGSLQGLSLNQQGQPIGSADSIGFGTLLGSTGEQGRLAYWFELQGLALGPALPIPLPPSLVPRELRFGIELSQISRPLLEGLVQVVNDSFNTDSALAAKPDDAIAPGAGTMPQLALQQLLMEHPIKLTIPDTYLRADDAGLEFDAAAATDPATALGGTGEVSLEVRGLPTLLAATGLGQHPQIAPMLGMFTAFAERNEQDGVTVDKFQLSLSPQGQLLLNGQDIGPMFGLAPGG